MTTAVASATLPSAEHIPYVTPDEAFALMQTSFERFMKVIESLRAEDWTKPTACTEWNVHDIVAHQAGGYASGVRYKEMFRQYSKIRAGRLPEDAINELQVRERAQKLPSELTAELYEVGPIAIHNWAYNFRFIKTIIFPHSVSSFKSVRDLMWIIHSRDTWMHRLDICRATGRPFEQTKEHDGRINELVVLDLAQSLKHKVGKHALTLVLTGVAGGTWKIGQGTSEAVIEMDTLDFNIYTSGHFNYQEGRLRSKFSGDQGVADLAFKNFIALY